MRRMRRGLIGLGYRPGMSAWLAGGTSEVGCLELTAEHFFDAPDSAILAIGDLYPCSVHGLGLSLGTPGPVEAATLTRYARVARLADAHWATEHIAFTHAAGIDLGHLNPVAPTEDNLSLLIEHALAVHEATGLPICLENITSQLRLAGSISETEFVNALCCASPHIRLLLDVTNLYVNARNHRFEAAHGSPSSSRASCSRYISSASGRGTDGWLMITVCRFKPSSSICSRQRPIGTTLRRSFWNVTWTFLALRSWSASSYA
jgi:uncharacterized protein (UPF0276 family)